MLAGCSDDKIFSHNSLTTNTKKINIMPLGDSITQGIHIDSKNTSYRRELYKLLKYNDFEIDFVGSMKIVLLVILIRIMKGMGGGMLIKYKIVFIIG